MSLCVQMIDEHLLAFKCNNAIITGFRVGWMPFFMGCFRLVTPVAAGVSLFLVSGATAYMYARYVSSP